MANKNSNNTTSIESELEINNVALIKKIRNSTNKLKVLNSTIDNKGNVSIIFNRNITIKSKQNIQATFKEIILV